ncbi:hypothetical protein GGI04_003329 [Coemansia thaxteri]|uniref:Oxidized purine nucleoside triphosphate hydrolase n=1 Tax=Coemansia thaxteri TaxID=2663907 RepID=A0A9W8BIV0_9FUNG|nr:hypothetical protein GGI04_003329 [Coemansia thaxteri]KAJ2002586.1 hypothetical protein H4R26_003534 [Coemansia thaxteri]KAJ2471106.1 hypothetical protein GGI02_002494 [Coemansia sp. RSA 2322]KAJ2479812.1 hypothetical protein EV174_003913 [Coemansia sp. RSA 2320]
MDSRSVAHHIEDSDHQAMAHRLYTLVFPLDSDNNRVLLGLKKRGFGCNKFNGFGGKVEATETIAEGAVRELVEESGLVATSMQNCGLLLFYFENDPVAMEVHVYLAHTYEGTVIESDEMRPQWFDIHDMPFSQMWADDSRWWPFVLRGEKFVGQFWLKADQATITREHLYAVESLGFV